MDRIVYVSGVFDLFHFGHMKLFIRCKELYPDCFFMVGVHNDKDCTTYKRKPIMTHDERMESIKQFGMNPFSKCIDMVIANAPLVETEEFYQLYGINVVIHAHPEKDDNYYKLKFYQDADRLGYYRRIDYTSEISTSDLIERNKFKEL
jgi:cytidyltransferase-like protein